MIPTRKSWKLWRREQILSYNTRNQAYKACRGVTSVSPAFNIESGLQGLQGQKRSPAPHIKTGSPDLQDQRFAFISPGFNMKTGLYEAKTGVQGQRYASATPGSQGTNKYYPDVSEFHGDDSKWEVWQLHLQSKFRASAILFPTE